MSLWKKMVFVSSLLLPTLSFPFCYNNATPWFTGPLITGSANNLDVGLVSIQPYLFFRTSKGIHNRKLHLSRGPSTFVLQAATTAQTGITNWLDVTIGADYFYRKSRNVTTHGYGDTDISFGFQLLKDKRGTAQPSIRLTLAELFPTGRYTHLDPHKGAFEATSAGTFLTSTSLRIGKTVYWLIEHPMSFRAQIGYGLPSNVGVSGFNTYGGGYGTKGTVKPGHLIDLLFGYELSLTRHFALAFDLCNFFTGKTTFSGTKGVDALGNPASTGVKAITSVSMAPALEYNINENYGLIAGAWFSVYGKNDVEFKSYVVSFTMTF